VTVAYYRDGRMVDFNTPIGQVTEAFHGFAAADYRKKVTEAATEALKQRAGVGAVVGGTIPGYRNVRRNGFVYRAIDPATAPLIKRIFALYTEDLLPQRTIAKLVGWSKPEVKHALTRSIYTGRIVSRWRDGSVFAVTDETLRIIDDRTWQAAQRRRAADRRLYLREPETGRLWSKPARTVESRWLLAGFLRCGACGGGMVAITRHQQKHFICLRHFQGRGAARGGWCGSKLAVPMRALDRAVLDRIVPLIDADVLKDAHAEALRIIRSRAAVTDRTRWTAALRRVDAEVARLVGYIKRGRASDAVSRALAEAEATQRDLRARLAELESYAATAQQMAATQAATLDDVLARWRAVFDAGHVPQLRQLLAKLLRGERLTVTGDLSDRKRRWATFSGAVSLAPLLGGLVVPATARAVPDHLSARTQVSLLPPPWEELTT
jgi:hypothetical protein